MKYASLVVMLLLSGCSTTVPVKQTFPIAPEKLLEQCPQLITVPENQNTITDLLKTVVKNYTTYYECATKHDGLVEWYSIQKEIFNGANK